MILTDEEILGCYPTGWLLEEMDDTDRAIAKAQAKKIHSWGNGVCVDKTHHKDYDCMYRHCCLECWQALLEEIK